MLNNNELYNWMDKNVHDGNWRMAMKTKILEEDIKLLSVTQIEAIQLFISLIEAEKYFMGGNDGVIRISSIDKCLEYIKKITNTTN